MFETYLNDLSELLIKINTDAGRSTKLVNAYLTLSKLLLKEIRDESCKTPAGRRWFKDQLQIYNFISGLNKDTFNANLEKNENNYANFDILYNEFCKMIKSGKNRYI